MTPWIPLNGGGTTQEFRCDPGATVSYRIAGHGGRSGTYVEDGKTYTSYPIGNSVGSDGIWYVFGMRFANTSGAPEPVVYASDRELYRGAGDPGGGTLGARYFVKFIRMGDVPFGRITMYQDMVIQTRLYEDGVVGGPLAIDVSIGRATLDNGVRRYCSVRAKNVRMPTIALAAFRGEGSTAGQRTFEVELECEAGVGQVNYQMVPTTPVLDGEQGVVEASGGVGGVGYQFLKEDGVTPQRFYQLEEFGQGESTAKVLKRTFVARYRQTGPVITAGDANTALTVSLDFP